MGHVISSQGNGTKPNHGDRVKQDIKLKGMMRGCCMQNFLLVPLRTEMLQGIKGPIGS